MRDLTEDTEEAANGTGASASGPVICILSDAGPAVLIRTLELLKTAGIALDLYRLSHEAEAGQANARLDFAASTDLRRLAVVARKVSQLPGVQGVTTTGVPQN